MKRNLIPVLLVFVILLTGILLAACGSSGSSSSGSNSGTPLSGQALMQERCSVCHSLDRVTSAQKTADQWKTTVDRMINHGAQLTSSEGTTLINYLAQTYHP
jgi:mono/diheme cytochrome c family protein